MAGLRIHIVMPPELVRRVDAALVGEESRGEFVRRAVEDQLALVESVPRAGESAQAANDRVQSANIRRAGAVEQPKVPCHCVGGNCMAGAGGLLPGQFCRQLLAEQPPLKQGPPQTFPPVPADPIVIDPEPPRGARAVSQPGPDVSRIRSSAQVQRSGPVPKKGKS